jgi:LacI family transcriptional regulator
MTTVTIKDIAARAQVNPATVSKALRGLPGKVAPDTRERIERIARELGYRPNAAAATLRTRRSNLIGIIVPDLGNPLFGPLVQGLERQLREAGWMCVIVQTPGTPDARREVVTALANRQVAGLVISSAESDDAMLLAADELKLPVVLVNRGLDERRFSSVVNDDRESVRLVVEHLVQLGHRRIAHLAGPWVSSIGRARKQAFEALCKREPGVAACVVDAPAFTREAGFAAMNQLLARTPADPPTAVFAANDLMAVGAIDAACRAGLRVPQDLSVVGHNDMPLVDMIAPPLTTVHVSVDRMSHHAAELLQEQLSQPGLPPMQRILTPTLVLRQSTAAPRAG